MSLVTIEESDDERSIVTPEFRLRFRWVGDRWTHSIETPADPWIVLAEVVEWTEAASDPAQVVSPTYQELHFQEEGDAVFALLVGAAGPHHFSASVHVSRKISRSPPPYNQGLEYHGTRIVFDVADRCRMGEVDFESNYVIHSPPIREHLGCSCNVKAFGELNREWHPRLDWTLQDKNSYQVMLSGICTHRPPTSVGYVDRLDPTRWQVRIASPLSVEGSTRRMSYAWSHQISRPIRDDR